MSINTYPEMNESIKYLLGMSDEPFKQYTLQRILELEETAARVTELETRIEYLLLKNEELERG